MRDRAMQMATASSGEPQEDSWESCDLEKLKLNDPPSTPAGPESGRRATAQAPAAPQPQDDSLEFDDSQSSTSAYSSSAGLSSAGAIAVTTVEHDMPIDPALTAALENPRERVPVLKFEDRILQFMKTPGVKQLDFPPLSSYQRLIVHRLAQRFQLEHQAIEPTYNTVSDQRSILLFKTPTSLVPRVLLIDLVSRERSSSEAVAPKPGLKLMRRDRPGDAGRNGGRNGGGRGGGQGEGKGPGSAKSVSEREREYAEARARIFGTSTSSSGSGSGSGAGSGKGGGEEEKVEARAAANGGAGNGAANGQAQAQGQGQEDERRRDGASPDAQRRPSPDRAKQPSQASSRQWSEQRKVTWRNREAELSDPDFVRNPHAYRTAPSYSSSGGYPMSNAPSMAQQPQPPSAPHMGGGYMVHPQHAAPPSARGQMGGYATPAYYAQTMHAVDYSRLPPGAMPMQYGMYPPNMMASSHGAYPMHTHSPPPPPPTGSRSGTGGDYNAAFPPLG